MTIKDKLIDPYQIDFDGTQYTLSILKTNKKGLEVISNLHYFTKLSTTLQKVVSLKLGGKESDFSLKDYITEFNNLLSEFEKSIKI